MLTAHQSETPLHWACALGDLEVVQCLVAKGCDLYAKDKVCRLVPTLCATYMIVECSMCGFC